RSSPKPASLPTMSTSSTATSTPAAQQSHPLSLLSLGAPHLLSSSNQTSQLVSYNLLAPVHHSHHLNHALSQSASSSPATRSKSTSVWSQCDTCSLIPRMWRGSRRCNFGRREGVVDLSRSR